MTDETAPKEPTDDDPYPNWTLATDPDERDSDAIFPRDIMLDAFLSMTVGVDDTEPGPGGFPITMVCGGVLLTGTVITRGEWQKRMLEEFAASPGVTDAFTDGIKVIFEGTDTATKNHRDRREAANIPQNTKRHIYLRDATIVVPGGDYKRALWRGNLADVTGWSVGA